MVAVGKASTCTASFCVARFIWRVFQHHFLHYKSGQGKTKKKNAQKYENQQQTMKNNILNETKINTTRK